MKKRILDDSEIEKMAKELGYINLRWYPCGDDSLKKISTYHYENEKTKYVLYGCPKDYNGLFADYLEPIFAQVVNNNRMKTRGYRKIKGEFGGVLIVGKWAMKSF